MKRARIVLWGLGILLVIAIVAAISVPNLMRAPRAAGARYFSSSSVVMNDLQAEGYVNVSKQSPVPDKKVIYNANLSLIVTDVKKTAEDIRKLVESQKGEVQEMELSGSKGSSQYATIRIRVPAASLSTNLDAIKKLAVWTEKESVSSKDVTREFYDNEAHMRNLHAEEEQYLKIMQQAHTVKDTLEVSQKLSDVRDRIERLQTQIQLMTHDIEMSVIDIRLVEESDARVFGIEWRPLYNAKTAARDLLSGITDWLDFVVALVIKLPLILLWLLTVVVIGLVLWRIGKRIWSRFRKPLTSPL